MSARRRRVPLANRWPGAAIVVASVFTALPGFVSWLVVDLGSGDVTLTGWGSIGGGQSAGENINSYILDGGLSYRPALLPTSLAALALFTGLRLIFARSKIAATAAIACGLLIAVWGGYSALSPSTVAGILDAGESRTSAGPWLVLVCGLAIVGGGVWVLWRSVDTPEPMWRTRGIQHPR